MKNQNSYNVSDLLDPEKMHALDEKFRPATQEDFDKAREMVLKGISGQCNHIFERKTQFEAQCKFCKVIRAHT